MCINDWRAGRFIKSVARIVELTQDTPFQIASNRQRVGIRFAGAAGDVGAGGVFDVLCDGAVIFPSAVIPWAYSLTIANDGDLPMRAFTLLSPTATGVTVGVVELLLPEEFLNKGTEEWQRVLLG